MTIHDEIREWRKSSFSGERTNCVEFRLAGDGVQVRDSKTPRAGF